MSDMMFREPNQIKWLGTRPGHNGTQKIIKIESGANVELYEVTAGLTFFLTAYYIGFGMNTAKQATLEVRNVLDAIQYYLGYPSSAAVSTGSGIFMSFYFPLEIPAGYDFYITTTGQVRGFIAGWEE